MTDFSFIRLKPTLSEALDTETPAMSEFNYFTAIQLFTDEKYIQVTNVKNGIAFDGNYSVFVCSVCGDELLDITVSVEILEFTDNYGKQQIQFTIENIGQDFYMQPVVLKFKHRVSDLVWFSNPIIISDYKKNRTSLFIYRDYAEFKGIAYNRVNDYQIIRLACAFVANDEESKGQDYITIDGYKYVSRLVATNYERYNFEQIDNFTNRRLSALLSHPVVYINDKRVTDKQTLQSKDIKGLTNLMDIDFKVSVNENELFSELQTIIIDPPVVADFLGTDFSNTDFFTN